MTHTYRIQKDMHKQKQIWDKLLPWMQTQKLTVIVKLRENPISYMFLLVHEHKFIGIIPHREFHDRIHHMYTQYMQLK